MRFANIIRLNAAGEREVVSMRWGFAGKGDLNPSRPRHMHARCETVDRLPTFANAFTHRRGVLVVHTFNEGEELSNGKTKQWVITRNDGKPIAIAVICEKWTNGTVKRRIDSSPFQGHGKEERSSPTRESEALLPAQTGLIRFAQRGAAVEGIDLNTDDEHTARVKSEKHLPITLRSSSVNREHRAERSAALIVGRQAGCDRAMLICLVALKYHRQVLLSTHPAAS